MHIYIPSHSCTFTYLRNMCIHYLHTHTHSHTFTHMHIHIPSHTCAFTCLHTHTFTYLHTHVHSHAFTHTCTHTPLHTRVHSYICTCTCTLRYTTYMYTSIQHKPGQLCDHIPLCVHHEHISPNALVGIPVNAPRSTHNTRECPHTAHSHAHSWLLTFIDVLSHDHPTFSHTHMCASTTIHKYSLAHICTLTILTLMHSRVFCFSFTLTFRGHVLPAATATCLLLQVRLQL